MQRPLLVLPLLLLVLLSAIHCHAAAATQAAGSGGGGPDETTSSSSSNSGATALASDPLASPRGSSSASTIRLTSSRSAPYVANELLLRAITQECAKRQDSVLQLDAAGRLQVLPALPADAPCGALDIALRGSERGVGMCTDAALYLLHMGPSGREGQGARVVPLLPDAAMVAYNAKCAQTTARMFLESMYHEWLAPEGSNGYHLMQVNSEHMFKVHQKHHEAMDVFLCKTQVCQKLVWQYVTSHRMKGEVWYIGHTSSDVLVDDKPAAAGAGSSTSTSTSSGSGGSSKTDSSSSDGAFVSAPPGALQQQQPRPQEEALQSPIRADFNRFIHVKGKSGLKHTKQLLECWSAHPEFPPLTVIGQSSLDDPLTRAVLDGRVKNVQLLPKPGVDQAAAAAVDGMARRLAEASERTTAAAAAAVAATAAGGPGQPASAPAPPAAVAAAGQPASAPEAQAGSSHRKAARRKRKRKARKAGSRSRRAGQHQPSEQQQQEPPAAVTLASLRTPEFEAARAKVNQLLGFMGQQLPAAEAGQAGAGGDAAAAPGAGNSKQAPAAAPGAASVELGPPAAAPAHSAPAGSAPQPQPQTPDGAAPHPPPPRPVADDDYLNVDAYQQPDAEQQQQEPEAEQQQPEAEAHNAAAAPLSSKLATKVGSIFGGLLHQPAAAGAASAASDSSAALADEESDYAFADADAAAGTSQQRRRLLGAASTSTSAAASTTAVHQLAARQLMWTPPLLQKDQLLSFADIRQLQAASGVHICASEREGFGHYLNEARGAGALVVSTDHPPMSEMVQDGVTGVLIKPSRTGSYHDWQALAEYAPLNAFLEAHEICAAVQRVLGLSLEQRAALGAAARRAYLLEKSVFAHKVKTLRRVLNRRRLLLQQQAAVAGGGQK